MLQIPVFLSLFWVLREFTPTARSNQVFDRAGVESFLNADLFGAKLGNWVSQPAAQLAAFGTDTAHMVAVGVPLMLVAGLATFLSVRAGLARQAPANPQLARVSRAMMYLAPAGVLVSGSFFPVPIGVLLYFLANNVWTFSQQHVLAKVVDREEAARGGAGDDRGTTAPRRSPTRGVRQVRAGMREDLKAALEARDRVAASALRSALAAIEHAEALPVAPRDAVVTGNDHVAGAVAGPGATEAERRRLTVADVRAVVEEEVRERTAAAEECERLGRDDHAARLRAEAQVLGRYLDGAR